MPRKLINTQILGPFHISARCINKEWFGLPQECVWEIFSNQLFLLAHAFEFHIHSFVLMANHYHLIASTPLFNLSYGMAYFQREVSRELNRRTGRINQNFGGRYFKCCLGSYHYFLNCYKYVYQNPLRKNLVQRVEEYPSSTLNGLLGDSHLTIPLVPDDLLFDGRLEENLKWLNTLPTIENLDAIRGALRHQNFKLKKDPFTRKAHPLEDVLL